MPPCRPGQLGVAKKGQLLRLNVASLLISAALDDGPGPPIKYQYAELAKLYQFVSTLLRCCNVSSLTQSFGAAEGSGPSYLPNPFLEPALGPCRGSPSWPCSHR